MSEDEQWKSGSQGYSRSRSNSPKEGTLNSDVKNVKVNKIQARRKEISKFPGIKTVGALKKHLAMGNKDNGKKHGGVKKWKQNVVSDEKMAVQTSSVEALKRSQEIKQNDSSTVNQLDASHSNSEMKTTNRQQNTTTNMNEKTTGEINTMNYQQDMTTNKNTTIIQEIETAKQQQVMKANTDTVTIQGMEITNQRQDISTNVFKTKTNNIEETNDWNNISDERMESKGEERMEEKENEKSEPNCDINCDNLYLNTDKGPFVVHLSAKMKTGKEVERELHDVTIGLKLKELRIGGVVEIKKISKRELKVIFNSKENANEFLKSNRQEILGVEAYIPKYNVTKLGIVFDIPIIYTEEYLMRNLEAEVPITGVYRCQKRKFVDGKKSKDWIPANTIKVTFRGQQVPDEVVFGFSKRKVKPDVPDPVQCFRCLRFGHIIKHCKQESSTCQRCSIQHEFSRDRPCESPVKCFHCHSDKHNGTSKDCPEYLRNKLIKESMYFNNVTFREADEQFPKTQSHFRLAERKREFPELNQRKGTKVQERVEASFPRKTQQDLRKDYDAYLQINQGKKPSVISKESKTPTYSEVTQADEDKEERGGKSEGVAKHGTELRSDERRRSEGRATEEYRAFGVIKDLAYKLQTAGADPDQGGRNSLANDLLLIDVGRMVMDFLLTAERKETPYDDVGEGQNLHE